jgi:hypothetical protein
MIEGREMHFSHLVAVFAVSTGMVGVCLTAIGVIQLVAHTTQMQTRCDEVLMLSRWARRWLEVDVRAL